MKNTFDRRIEEIRRGIYSFREIGDVKTKKEMASILVKEYEDGIITDAALKSLIDYYIDQIKIFKRISIDDLPSSIKDLVVEKMK